MKPKKPEILEPRCWCGGYIVAKLNGQSRYPYACMKCNTEYQTLPPAHTNRFLLFLETIFKKY